MSDAAASSAAAPAAPAAESGPSQAAGPDKGGELEAQIQAAIKAGESAEEQGLPDKPASSGKAKSKAPPKKAEPKSKAAPVAAKAEPAKAEHDADAENESEAESEAPAAKKSARQLFEEGDLDAAFKAAFGVDSSAFNINSKKWAEWRQATKRIKDAHERRVREEFSQVHAERQRVAELLHAAREEVRPYTKFIQARQLYENGDIEAAIKLAFDSDASDFNKRLIRGVAGKPPEDPRVTKLERELQEMRAEKERQVQEWQQQQARQAEIQQRQSNLEIIRSKLPELEEPEYAEAAKRPRFVARVLEVLEENYDEHTQVTLPLQQAAEMVRREFEENFGANFAPRGVPVSTMSARGGSIPARPEARSASTTLSQKGAAEASAPKRGPDNLSLEEHVRMFSMPQRKPNGARP